VVLAALNMRGGAEQELVHPLSSSAWMHSSQLEELAMLLATSRR
jgi:hypothetical protein